VNIDERVRGMLEGAKRKRDFSLKDKEEGIRQVNRQFDAIIKRIEEKKNQVIQMVVSKSENEVNKID
jgi:hypothetical protein